MSTMFMWTSSSSESVIDSATPDEFYKVVLRYTGCDVPSAVYSEISAPRHSEVKANIGGLFVAEFRTPKLISRYGCTV